MKEKKNELYIYRDIATRSGLIAQLKKNDVWQPSISVVGELAEIIPFLTDKVWDYAIGCENLIIRFVTYNVPFVKGNVTTSNKLSFLRGLYLGIVKGLFNIDEIEVESYSEYETTVSKEILGSGGLTRKEKKALTKELMNEKDEDLADAKMLMTYCQKKNTY